jgi:hypothetical protein
LDVVRVLLRAGANPNRPVYIAGGDWHTSRTAVLPFSVAVERGYEEIVKAMLGAGANPIRGDVSGVLPVNVALSPQYAGSMPHYHVGRTLVGKTPKSHRRDNVMSVEPEVRSPRSGSLS